MPKQRPLEVRYAQAKKKLLKLELEIKIRKLQLKKREVRL